MTAQLVTLAQRLSRGHGGIVARAVPHHRNRWGRAARGAGDAWALASTLRPWCGRSDSANYRQCLVILSHFRAFVPLFGPEREWYQSPRGAHFGQPGRVRSRLFKPAIRTTFSASLFEVLEPPSTMFLIVSRWRFSVSQFTVTVPPIRMTVNDSDRPKTLFHCHHCHSLSQR